MKKILVTGGAGFIGSHLVEALLKDNYQVTVLDNFSNGSLKNLETLKKSPYLEIINVDVSEKQKIAPYFKDREIVFHLAAMADIVPSIQEPAVYFRSNVEGTFSVMECAKESGAGQVVYIASSSCYGIPDIYPTPEEAPIRPQYPYALTKYLGECLALHWGQVYKVPVNSLRLFNVYGPRARTGGTYGAVFKVFLPQKIHGKPFTVVGDGTQTRDFTYVSDAVEAMILLSRSRLCGEILNVGSGQTVSVNRLVELLGGKDVVHIPKRPGEPDCTFADISRIRERLGWSPKVSIEEGVGKTLADIHYWKDAPLWTPETIASATKDWFHYLSR